MAHDWRSHFTTEVPFMVILKSGYLNLRSGPGVEHPVLASLKNGTRGLTLETCVQHAKWCRVSDGAGKRGWVLSKFIGGYAT